MFQQVPLSLWKLNWPFNMYVFPIHLLVFSASQEYTLIWGEFPNIHTVPNLGLMLLFPSLILWLSSFQLLSRVWLFVTPWTAACQAALSITNFWSLFKVISIVSMMPFNHLILYRALLPPSIFPSIRVFSSESVLCIRWPKYWSFSFSFSPSNEYSGLISFRMDWLDPLAVQGTLKSLLQHHSSKASILRHSAFFMVQLSHLYMKTRKTIALTTWNFVDKVMSLLFHMLSRLVTAFLPNSKHLLISWLQSPSAVILEPPKIKSLSVSIVSPSICMKWWDQLPWSLFSECWALSQLFHSPLSLSSRGFLVPLHFLP